MFEWILKPNSKGEYMNINVETGIINYARCLEWCPYLYQGQTTVRYIFDNITNVDDWIISLYLQWHKKRKVCL